MVILRAVPDAPLADRTELRLTGANNEAFDFTWIESATEMEPTGLSVPRDTYDAIDTDPVPWLGLRQHFTDAFFVDLRRLFLAGPVT
jgi:hypothetical protein